VTPAQKEEYLDLIELRDRWNRTQQLQDCESTENNVNYNFILKSLSEQQYDSKDKLIAGYGGVVLEGSSRSGKTWSGVDFIIYLSTILHVTDGCTINIYRETYNEFKTTLYDDFKRRLDDFGLPNKFKEAEEVKSFKIGNSKVYFLGDGKHGGGCDYAFFNEAMMIKRGVFDQVEMRCRKFWWMDYNPSFTEHWIFNSVITRPDVGFLRTTFNQNTHISIKEKNKILGYEPWLPGSYQIEGNKMMYRGEEVSDKNQPPPHPENIEYNTVDEFNWKVYGLGLRGSMKGLIFNNVQYIDEFPSHVAHTYGLDFGFTNDPTALVKYGEEGPNIYLELLCYQPMETPDIIDSFLKSIGISKHDPITADSADRFTHQTKGSFQMVSALYEMDWEVEKVVKTHSVMFWITSMRKKKIYIVRNALYKFARKEAENYRFMEINGIAINKPEDKFNHFWDGSRYAHMSYDSGYSSDWQ